MNYEPDELAGRPACPKRVRHRKLHATRIGVILITIYTPIRSDPSMPKRNIYVDDDLNAELVALEVSISPVCQQALRREVAIRRRLADVQESAQLVARRLIDDKAAADAAGYQQGFDVGTDWASNSATWAELSFLGHYGGRRGWLVLLGEDHSLRGELYSRAMAEGYEAEFDWFDRLDFDKAFDRGVVEGALTVLDAVRAAVEAEADLQVDGPS